MIKKTSVDHNKFFVKGLYISNPASAVVYQFPDDRHN